MKCISQVLESHPVLWTSFQLAIHTHPYSLFFSDEKKHNLHCSGFAKCQISSEPNMGAHLSQEK